MVLAAIFFGVVGLSVLNGLYHFGAYHGVRMRLIHKLPEDSLLRAILVRPENAVSALLDRIAANPVRWSIRTFAIAYFVGGITYSLLEKDASVFDGLWWAYISMMTVGYGDFSPKTWLIRTEAYIVVLLGWSALLIMGAALSGRIAERRLQHADDTPELHDDVEALCKELETLHGRLQQVGLKLKERETNSV